MKKIIFAFTVSTLILYFIGCSILKPNPRNPIIKVETSYKLGWWPHQDYLSIDSFKILVIENNLSLLNSYSLIRYRIKGRLICNFDNWSPYIEKININERFQNKTVSTHQINFTDTVNKIALIEFTPIVKLKNKKEYKKGQTIEFEIINEHLVQSYKWGLCVYKFKCDTFERLIQFNQFK